jgi:UDP-N-acetylglucosamine 2-epimerase
MLQHPVTTEYGAGLGQIDATLDAVAALGHQALVFWPNVDAGSGEVSKGIRMFREQGRDAGFHFLRNVPAEQFIKLMAHCSVMVGNSSAALREGAFLGTPAVNVGTRQHGREHAANVIDVGYDAGAIADAMRDQIVHGRYERDAMFGDGTTGRQIAAVLAEAQVSPQKRLSYDAEALSAG